MSGFLIGIFAFSFLILFAIFFHELGHFVTARWSGIKVSRFFVGFGPTLWSFRSGLPETVVGPDGKEITRPETEYGIKALPLGGFVKIVGMSAAEELRPEEEPRSFPAAPAWKRAIVLSAGSVTHFITAFIVMFLIFAVVGVPDPDRPTLEIEAVQLEIAGETSPAARAGLEPGDRIVAVDGRRITTFDQVREGVRAGQGEPVHVELLTHEGQRREVDISPVMERTPDGVVPVIGIFPAYESTRVGPIESVTSSGRVLTNLVGALFQRVPQAFTPETLGLTGEGPTDERPFSIVGAGRIAGDLASRGSLVDFLFLFVQINVFIALFNMLPLPPLDGGHLLVLGIEKLRGKPIDQRALVPVMAVVLSLLLLLGVLLLYYDIVQPPQLPAR